MNCLVDHQTMALCTSLLNQVYTHSTWTGNIQILPELKAKLCFIHFKFTAYNGLKHYAKTMWLKIINLIPGLIELKANNWSFFDNLVRGALDSLYSGQCIKECVYSPCGTNLPCINSSQAVSKVTPIRCFKVRLHIIDHSRNTITYHDALSLSPQNFA